MVKSSIKTAITAWVMSLLLVQLVVAPHLWAQQESTPPTTAQAAPPFTLAADRSSDIEDFIASISAGQSFELYSNLEELNQAMESFQKSPQHVSDAEYLVRSRLTMFSLRLAQRQLLDQTAQNYLQQISTTGDARTWLHYVRRINSLAAIMEIVAFQQWLQDADVSNAVTDLKATHWLHRIFAGMSMIPGIALTILGRQHMPDFVAYKEARQLLDIAHDNAMEGVSLAQQQDLLKMGTQTDYNLKIAYSELLTVQRGKIATLVKGWREIGDLLQYRQDVIAQMHTFWQERLTTLGSMLAGPHTPDKTTRVQALRQLLIDENSHNTLFESMIASARGNSGSNAKAYVWDCLFDEITASEAVEWRRKIIAAINTADVVELTNFTTEQIRILKTIAAYDTQIMPYFHSTLYWDAAGEPTDKLLRMLARPHEVAGRLASLRIQSHVSNRFENVVHNGTVYQLDRVAEEMRTLLAKPNSYAEYLNTVRIGSKPIIWARRLGGVMISVTALMLGYLLLKEPSWDDMADIDSLAYKQSLEAMRTYQNAELGLGDLMQAWSDANQLLQQFVSANPQNEQFYLVQNSQHIQVPPPLLNSQDYAAFASTSTLERQR